MIKPTLLAPRAQVREILSDGDASQMLRSGSWVRVAATRPLGKGALEQRQFREHCREKGLKQLSAWIPADTFKTLHQIKRDGESVADVIERIVRAFSLIE